MMAGALWYANRSGRCRHEKPSKDGKRMIRCERFARLNSDRCPAHSKTLRTYDAQQTCAAIVAFFDLVRL